jgi:large subunit ribosomal protein L21
MNKLNPFTGRTKKRSRFWWGIKLGAVLAFGIWWLLENNPEALEKLKEKFKPALKLDKKPEPQITIDQEETKGLVEIEAEPEDLRVIEGLGPKSEQALIEAGIFTFAALAKMSSDEIHAVLKAAGVRVPFPETWPEQAALAAAGKWDKLKDLKDSLVGGRRV